MSLARLRGRARRGGALLLAVAALVAIAGCGGSATHTSAAPRAHPQGPAVAAGCSTAVAYEPALNSVRTAMVPVRGNPFGVVSTRDGRWSFLDEARGSVAVLSDASFAPRLLRTLQLPLPAIGASLTHNGRYLLIADAQSGAMVVSVARAQSGARDALLGTLSPPKLGRGFGAIEVSSSLDDRFAFVSVEYSSEVAVYDLHAALADDFKRSAFIGTIPLGRAVVGQALSPDGRWLYVTSEISRQGPGPQGTLSVIDVARAERDPGASVVATAGAHCGPVRVAVTPDGSTVWVTARETDQLLAFSAARLRSNPAHALLAAVRVGAAPVGLAVVDRGRRIVVADSNRFSRPGQRAELTIVDARAALAGMPALLGTIPAGVFPREMSLEANGKTLLVGNYASGQLEAVDLAQLP